MAVTVGNEGAVIFSTDRGLSWSMLAGSGLELETPWEVTYHPGLPAAGGAGLFIIGTEHGIWTWDPMADVVGTLHAGLGANDLQILDLEAPLAGSNGPVVALSARGNVYLLWPQAMTWTQVFSVPNGVYGRRGGVALSPHFNAQSGAVGARDIYAAGSGRLYVSRDAGQTWTAHQQFPTTARNLTDWSIATVSLSENYLADGLVMLGRVKQDIAAGADRGEIWRSANFGTSFNRVQATYSGVLSLLGTPPGPTGARTWLASTRAYPNTGVFIGTGILISKDGGLTWNDYGNDQDFLLEDNPGKTSGNIAQNYEQQLCVMPDYATRGEVWYGRQEGLFASADEGIHWEERQIRVEREFRDLETTFTSAGQKAIFGAGYGVGTVIHLPNLGVVDSLPDEPPMIYQRRLSLSPNFAQDGNLITAGNVTLWCWQDPNVPPANPNGFSLWWQPDNRDPVTGAKLTGFPRVVTYSPHFDGRALPGSDQTFFWCGWDFGPYRSTDNGLTAKALHELVGGGLVGETTCFAIAPTYDDAGARTDAYTAAASGKIYRLVNDQWLTLADLGPMVEDLLIPPDWSRPGNPSIYAALAGPPYVARVIDDPSNPRIIQYSAGLPAVDANGLCCDPDFANHPVLYLSTFGSGVWKLDLSAPSPAWVPFGAGFPRLWGRDVATSADFANDRIVYAATQDGIWQCPDVVGGTWQPMTTVGTRDETDESFQYYQPGHPNNPHPDHAWPWLEVKRWALPFPIVVFGESLRYTNIDGAYATTVADCSSLSVLTAGGPGSGTILITVTDFLTGAPVASRSLDLRPLATSPKEKHVPLALPGRQKVRVTVTAQLDPGEVLVLDGIEFKD